MRDPGQMEFLNLPLMTHAVDTGKGEKKKRCYWKAEVEKGKREEQKWAFPQK